MKRFLTRFLTGSALVAIILFACDQATLTSPTPPPAPPPVNEPPVPPPVHHRGQPFSWDGTRGILTFAGTQATELEIEALHQRLRNAGWPRVTFNVCSEVAEWETTPWADGPAAFSQENLDNLDRFLQTTAKLGAQVRLNIFCTVRDNQGWMAANGERYARTVVGHVKDYDHVFLSVANEPYHPNSWLRSGDRVRRVRDWARVAGFAGPMGADDTIGGPHTSFRYAYANLGFPADFHPYRNPDPNAAAFQRMVDENSRPVIISEPTAYSSWRDGGCCTADRQQILSYMNRAERVGIIWFYHSTDGLEWPRKDFEWFPR